MYVSFHFRKEEKNSIIIFFGFFATFWKHFLIPSVLRQKSYFGCGSHVSPLTLVDFNFPQAVASFFLKNAKKHQVDRIKPNTYQHLS